MYKIKKFQRNLSTIFLKLLNIYFFSKIFQKVKIVMLRWNILQYLKKNVARIFQLQWKIRNISDICLQYSVLFGYLIARVASKYRTNPMTQRSKYFLRKKRKKNGNIQGRKKWTRSPTRGLTPITFNIASAFYRAIQIRQKYYFYSGTVIPHALVPLRVCFTSFSFLFSSSRVFRSYHPCLVS